MHLWTKILGPSCMCVCEPAGPCICPHQGGHKMLSKPEPYLNEIFPPGAEGGADRPSRPHTGGEEGLFSSIWLTEVPRLSFHIKPQSLWKEQHTPESLKTRSIWRRPWSTPFSKKSLHNVPDNQAVLFAQTLWGHALLSAPSGKPVPPKCPWSPRVYTL